MKAGRNRSTWKAAVAAAVAGAVIGGGAWVVSGGESAAPRLDAQAVRIMHGRETRVFKNLEQLVGSTPYIIEGTVTGIQPGRSTGSAEDGGIDQARDVTLSVDVKYGKIVLPSTLVVEEWGWDEEGAGYQVENVAWSKVGDKGFYFLIRSQEAGGRYRLINTQGRALKMSDESLDLSADPDSELSAGISWMDSFEFGQKIRYLLQPANSDQLQTVEEPPVAPSASQDAPAVEDGTEEPLPDDSVTDGSEPGASAMPTSG
ncbi:hypothetical protein [Streptomyces sp. NPDC051569]|uniref:hypothetical protein n=1 Tax=Streptomyces sp. NPDC051569 TaxID=3365661 RepID=UPI0037B9F781